MSDTENQIPEEESEQQSTYRQIKEAVQLIGGGDLTKGKRQITNMGLRAHRDSKGNQVRRSTRERRPTVTYNQEWGIGKIGSDEYKTYFEDDLNSEVFESGTDDFGGDDEEEEEEEEERPDTDDEEAIVEDGGYDEEDDEYEDSGEEDESEDESESEEEDEPPRRKKSKTSR